MAGILHTSDSADSKARRCAYEPELIRDNWILNQGQNDTSYDACSRLALVSQSTDFAQGQSTRLRVVTTS